jgi:hypothetical protein
MSTTTTASERKQALDYYDKGWPSTLPHENIFKILVEAHRWGSHILFSRSCPVCVRDAAGKLP